MLKEEVTRETDSLQKIKNETANLKKKNEVYYNDVKNLQRAIVIKSKEICKHKLNLKTNEVKLKGVINSMSVIKSTVIGKNFNSINLESKSHFNEEISDTNN